MSDEDMTLHTLRPNDTKPVGVSISRTCSATRLGFFTHGNLSVYLEGRIIPDVPLPLQHILAEEDIYNKEGVLNIERLRHHLHGEGRLEIDCLLRIVTDAMRVMAREDNVVRVDGTVRVIGAVCGQFYDLLEILKKIDFAADEKCVFMGKYAWDNCFGTETIVYLYGLKIAYPDNVFLLRSQRETRLCSRTTFKNECLAKYNLDVYDCFCRSFEHLPLTAIVNRTTICVHGGISPFVYSLDDINKINRFQEPLARSALTDLMWADPHPSFGKEDDSTPCFSFNRERTISVYFTSKAFKMFMKRNDLACLVRANQPLFDGYFEYKIPSGAWGDYPLSMKAIFSAPNFKEKRNQGAMLLVTPSSTQVIRYLWKAAPYWLPNFSDCFTWSLPFLVRKATLFVSDLLRIMDRDTAAKDVQEALKKTQERFMVMSNVGKGKPESETVSQQRRVAFSPTNEITPIVTPEFNDDVETECSDLGSESHFQMKSTRCAALQILCCGALQDTHDDGED